MHSTLRRVVALTAALVTLLSPGSHPQNVHSTSNVGMTSARSP
jgi:hypothetical protein